MAFAAPRALNQFATSLWIINVRNDLLVRQSWRSPRLQASAKEGKRYSYGLTAENSLKTGCEPLLFSQLPASLHCSSLELARYGSQTGKPDCFNDGG
uniref:Uncharacterized protein n=1 Tax=Physcomitrium patens TaxID=3218 RepID=A0A2K1L8Y5_PHYPA|nr:hypothetical protein PHYPA_000906 [Physcomitrium patens]